MFRSVKGLYAIAVYVSVALVAVFVGYQLATPTEFSSVIPVALLIGILAAPLLLRHHHLLLIAMWNAIFIVVFLPGKPLVAMVLVFVSLLVAVIQRAMLKRRVFLPEPTVVRPLIFLLMVVIVTLTATGGLGGSVFGSEQWGARRYLFTFFGLFGYFALTSQAVPPEKAKLAAALFVLGGTTAALADLAYMLDLRPLFLFVSSDFATMQAVGETTSAIVRFTGLCWGAWAVFSFLLMRYGLKGVLELTRPWRLPLLLIALGVTLLGGYRSYIVLTSLLFLILFWMEGLHRTKAAIGLAITLALLGASLVAFVDRLPLSVQRAVSILPLEVHPVAKLDAQGTLDWRIEMWKVVIPEVPKYFWLGKGFTFSGTDLYLTFEAMRRGVHYKSFEPALVNGNYHSGILTLLIPFGVWGAIGFAWFVVSALRVLQRNYRQSPPELLTINRYLLAAFVVRLIFFLVIYGQFDLDLPIFTGLVGLSVCLNAGHRQEAPAPATAALPVRASRVRARELTPA